MNPFFSTSALENNNVSRKDCLAHKAIVSMKAKRRKALKLLGYQQLSINTFYKEGETIILKSMVEDTNPYEFQHLSITKQLRNAIRGTSITIEGYVRSSFTAMDIQCIHRRYWMEETLFATVRSYKNSCTRISVYSHQHQYEIANTPHREFLEAA